MHMSRREWRAWIAATLAVAALVHAGAVYELPRLITARALARMGAPNAMHFPPRPDEPTRVVVRPSPDLLYSACPFNLADGPLRLTAAVPHSTYWSVSGFDAAGNNFFVHNDQQVAGDAIEITVLRRGTTIPPPGDAPERSIVFAPTQTGVFLFRLLINDEKQLATLDGIRRRAACRTVPMQSGR